MNDHEESLIEKYLEGHLTADENIRFDELMDSSQSFADEVAFQKKMLAHLEATIKKEQKSKLLSDLQRFKSEDQDETQTEEKEPSVVQEAKTVRMFPKTVWYTAAASVVIIIGFFAISNFGGQNPEDAYLSYYQPYDGVVNTRGDEAKSLDEVISLYNVGEYQVALNDFLKVENLEGITDGQYKLMVANCYLNINQPKNSLEWLKKISETEGTLVLASKDWYIALSHLKNKDIAAAKSQLNQIIQEKSVYTRKAEKLLKEDVFQ